MTLLYLDLVGGISGDMTVGALLELGVPLERLREALRQVGLTEVELGRERAERHHLAGTRFLVRHSAGATGDTGLAPQAAGHTHHAAPHGPAHAPAQSAHSHRPYREIRAMLERSALPEGARQRALRVFERLADAEATVHGAPVEEVTFHEVGAWDSIADVVCVAAALEALEVEEVLCSPVPTGRGTVTTAHGTMPIPAPATLLLLQGFPIVQGGPAYERTTPTGAAILAALARPAPPALAYVPQQVGVGIGRKDSPEVPNVLRAVLGKAIPEPAGTTGTLETIECAEANLDDANPEWLGYLMERLLAAGALDVALIPIHMKKNRPGTLVQVLYRPDLRDAVQGLLFSETTTLGVRYRVLERIALPRIRVSVPTPWGEVGGMEARHGERSFFSPEFDACRALAQSAGVPLREVYHAAQAAWQRTHLPKR